MRGSGSPTPAEQLRLALLDLQQANRDLVRHYAADREQAEFAAHVADEARIQAARWATIIRASESLDE